MFKVKRGVEAYTRCSNAIYLVAAGLREGIENVLLVSAEQAETECALVKIANLQSEIQSWIVEDDGSDWQCFLLRYAM